MRRTPKGLWKWQGWRGRRGDDFPSSFSSQDFGPISAVLHASHHLLLNRLLVWLVLWSSAHSQQCLGTMKCQGWNLGLAHAEFVFQAVEPLLQPPQLASLQKGYEDEEAEGRGGQEEAY